MLKVVMTRKVENSFQTFRGIRWKVNSKPSFFAELSESNTQACLHSEIADCFPRCCCCCCRSQRTLTCSRAFASLLARPPACPSARLCLSIRSPLTRPDLTYVRRADLICRARRPLEVAESACVRRQILLEIAFAINLLSKSLWEQPSKRDKLFLLRVFSGNIESLRNFRYCPSERKHSDF